MTAALWLGDRARVHRVWILRAIASSSRLTKSRESAGIDVGADHGSSRINRWTERKAEARQGERASTRLTTNLFKQTSDTSRDAINRRASKPGFLNFDLSANMPETAHHMNGYANGHTPPELQQDTSFLFTSESVGEGHPG